MSPRLIALCVVLSACAKPTTPAASQPSAVEAGVARAHVMLVTANGSRSAVTVEIATTESERERGLMYRRSLGPNDGMIFVFDDESDHTFWMKNTYVPLDMLFIAADGTIAGIVADATPETETPRTVGKPSQYVLEVNAGWSALKGVRPGDHVDLGDVLAHAH